jgi:hypothetical protein
MVKRPFFQIIPSVIGRDLWAFGTGNTLRWTWFAPRWMSFKSRDCSRYVNGRHP